MFSFFDVSDAVRIDRELGLRFGQIRRVIDTTDSVLSLSFLEVESSSGGVSYDMASDRLFGVGGEHCTGVYVSHHLIGDEYSDTELVGESLKHSHKPGQMHLTGSQFTPSAKIGSVESGCAVDHQKGVPRLRHHGRGLDQQLCLMVTVVGARVCDVIQYVVLIQTESSGDVYEPLGSERAFGVDVETLSFSAAHIYWQLTRDGQHMTQL